MSTSGRTPPEQELLSRLLQLIDFPASVAGGLPQDGSGASSAGRKRRRDRGRRGSGADGQSAAAELMDGGLSMSDALELLKGEAAAGVAGPASTSAMARSLREQVLELLDSGVGLPTDPTELASELQRGGVQRAAAAMVAAAAAAGTGDALASAAGVAAAGAQLGRRRRASEARDGAEADDEGEEEEADEEAEEEYAPSLCSEMVTAVKEKDMNKLKQLLQEYGQVAAVQARTSAGAAAAAAGGGAQQATQPSASAATSAGDGAAALDGDDSAQPGAAGGARAPEAAETDSVCDLVSLNERCEVTGQVPLVEAAASGNEEAVELLLRAGADPNACNEHGSSAAVGAASNGSVRVLQLLKELSTVAPDFCGADESGWTPLLAACASGNLEAAEWLAESAGADPLATEAKSKETTLMKAARGGHVDIMAWAARAGVDVNERSAARYTALHIVADARGAHDDACKWLLEHDAVVLAENRAGAAPLQLAAAQGHAGIVRQLLAAHTKADSLFFDSTTIYWALVNAVCELHGETAAALVQEGMDVNATRFDRTLEGATVQGGKILIDPKMPQHTLLTVAALARDSKVVKTVLCLGADIDVPSKTGETALSIAAARGDLVMVKALLAAGATVQPRGTACPIVFALCGQGSDEDAYKIVQVLAVCASDQNGGAAAAGGGARRRLSTGRRQPQRAVEVPAGPPASGWESLAGTVQVDRIDKAGATALHHACLRGHLPSACLLVSLGSSPLARDAKGRSPLDIARGAQLKLLSELLSEEVQRLEQGARAAEDRLLAELEAEETTAAGKAKKAKKSKKSKRKERKHVDKAKKLAAYAAVDNHVKRGMRLGIGSGSTVVFVVDRLKQLKAAGRLGHDVVCVPTSFQARNLIVEAGLPLSDLNATYDLDLAIDGADEVVKGSLDCIKGGGGCQTQEKLVASAAKKLVIVADYRKQADRLGAAWNKGVPVEVLPGAWKLVQKRIASELGLEARLRMGIRKAGPVVTDNGGVILDVALPSEGVSMSPQELHVAINALPGVVETGLFCSMASDAYFGMEDGSVEHWRKRQDA